MKKFTFLPLLLLALPVSLSAQQAEVQYKIFWDNSIPYCYCLHQPDVQWYDHVWAEIVKPEGDQAWMQEWMYNYYDGKDIVIPSYVIDDEDFDNPVTYPVYAIGRDAFKGLPMRSVNIPSGLHKINGNPFQDCPNLVEFKGECATKDGLCLIWGYREFWWDDVTQKILVAFANAGAPDNYDLLLTRDNDNFDVLKDNNLLYIGKDSFRNATKLKSITFKGNMYLRDNCFRGCTNLKKITEYSSFFDGYGVARETYYDEDIFEYRSTSGFFKDCPNIEYFILYDDINIWAGNITLFNEQDMDHVPVLIAARECFESICNDDFWKNAPCMLSINIPEEIKIENFHEPEAEKTATVFANIEKGSEDFEIAWNFPTTEIISAEDTETIGEKKLTANKLGRADFSLTLRQKTSDALLANVRKAPSQYSPLTLSSTMKITTPTGINSIDADNQEVDADAIYYSVNGMQVDKANLAPGIYIARGSKTGKKILVK